VAAIHNNEGQIFIASSISDQQGAHLLTGSDVNTYDLECNVKKTIKYIKY